MGYGNKEYREEATKRLLPLLSTTFKKGTQMKKTFKEIRKGYHRMPDGSIMKDSDHPKGAKKLRASYEDIEDTEEGVSPAQRRARKQAHLKKTMAKYRQASKMGIPASQVNQRRSHPTRKKS